MNRLAALTVLLSFVALVPEGRTQETMERPLGGPLPPGNARERTLDPGEKSQDMTCTVILPLPEAPLTCSTQEGAPSSLCQCEGSAVLGTRG